MPAKKMLSALLTAALAGCGSTTPITRNAENGTGVQIVRDRGVVARCTRLAEIRASSLVGGLLSSVGYDNMLQDLKDRGRAVGATHVLLLDSSSGQNGSNGFGEAYRC